MNKPGYKIEKVAERLGFSTTREENDNLKIRLYTKDNFINYIDCTMDLLLEKFDDDIEFCSVSAIADETQMELIDDTASYDEIIEGLREWAKDLKEFKKEVQSLNKCKKK